jgi:hypothetical protein
VFGGRGLRALRDESGVLDVVGLAESSFLFSYGRLPVLGRSWQANSKTGWVPPQLPCRS